MYYSKAFSKYLGILVDNKLSFSNQIALIKTKLGRHCGVVSKMRYCVPKPVKIIYYNSNFKPVIHYGRLLVYGCIAF